jgi:hypothetical protein
MPKYSVIIPTYNRSAFLREALASVWAQTYRDFEVIVCDDGSTDDTRDVLADWGDRVTVVHTRRRGPAAARNAAAAVATGVYLSCLDSDDVWLPWTLSSIDEAVQRHGSDGLVYLVRTPMEFGATRRWASSALKTESYDDFIASPAYASHGAGLIGAVSLARFMEVGGFWDALITDEDLDLVLRLGTDHPYSMIMEPVTMLHRTHEGNTARNMARLCEGALLVLDREFRECVYAGGATRAHARRSRLGHIFARRCVKLAHASEFRLALRLYYRGVRVFAAARLKGFILAFPPYVAARLAMARWGGACMPPA